MDKKQMQEFMNAVGVMAESSLLFFRSLLQAGASIEEASRLTQAYISVTMFGSGQKPTKEDKN